MKNNNTIELNVVRLGGGTSGSQPTKLSELTNDCGFVERENYTSGDYQISKVIVLYENEDEQEVITKTKGMNRVSLHINPLAEFGTSSKCGIQLIFKDLSGNEFLRFPNEDGWIEDNAELVDCIISGEIGNYIEMIGDTKSYSFYDSLPSEFKLYVQSHFGGERYFNLTCDVNGSMSIDTKFNQKQDILKSGTNIKTIGGQSILGGGNINLGTAAYVNVEDLQGGGDKWNLLQTISLSGSAQSFPIMSNMGEDLYTDGLLVVVDSSQDLIFNFGYGADQIKGKVIEVERLEAYPESGSPASMVASYLIKGDNSGVIEVVHPGFGVTTIEVSTSNGDELSGMIRLFYKKISNLKS